MAFRAALLVSVALVGWSVQASAGLLGSGKTVQAFYYNSVFTNPEIEIPSGALTGNPASLAAPVDYLQGAADVALIHVDDSQIVITNKSSGFPFCFANTVGNACADIIDGFDFQFTGESILGVTADFATAPGFRPVTGTFQGNTHLGLQLISDNEIRVDVTGDLALLDDQLILDVSFAGAPPPPPPPPTGVPEPMSALVLGSALAGLTALRRRRIRSTPH